MTRLVRSEFRKILTTNTWWLFVLGVLLLTAASFALNALQAHAFLHTVAARPNPAVLAANLYTSGQYFGLLFVLLLGILVVTNEFFHQTATSTFLVTPRRGDVIAAKLIATMLAALALCLGTMAACVIAGVIFLSAEGAALALTNSAVLRAMGLNLVAYAIWAVFGVGFGVLIRSQIAAVIVALALYLVASSIASAIFQIVAALTHADWVLKLAVLVPSIASAVMITGGDLPGGPPQWLGAVVLIAYGVVAGAAGTLLTQRRDIG